MIVGYALLGRIDDLSVKRLVGAILVVIITLDVVRRARGTQLNISSPWLAGIARYKWIDRLRAAARHAAGELPETLSTPDHEAAVISAAALHGLMASLKPAQADVIRLVKLDGLSIEEAAARTGQSVALVKVNIHRGLGRLARIVESSSDVD